MSNYGRQVRELDRNSELVARGASDKHDRLKRYDRCIEAIADEMDDNNVVVCGFGMGCSEQSAKRLAAKWVRHCRSVGILPPVWWPVWWAIRLWLIPALERLALQWLSSLLRVTVTGRISHEAQN